jgi:hypothetical protein
MNSYRLSDGTRISKASLDRKVREAKRLKLQQQRDELGYNVCTECWSNEDTPIDCSHTESVDSCQKNGRSEKAWDLDNIKILGRKCHSKHDKNCINYVSK